MKEYLKQKQITKKDLISLISALTFISLMLGFITAITIIMNLGLHVNTNITGSSMHESLNEQSRILYVSPNFKEIKRGDIVSTGVSLSGVPVEYGNTGIPFVMVKRVIGLPNETISIQGNSVFINNKLLEEPYAYYSGISDDDITITLGEDQYFVMGDNRLNSGDSRIYGPIDKENIIGVALLVR